MPTVLILDPAQNDLARLERFLEEKDQEVAERMKETIVNALYRLKESPNIGGPFRRFKRLIVRFGKSKYIVIYNYVKADNTVYVLSVRHEREDPGHPEHGQ